MINAFEPPRPATGVAVRRSTALSARSAAPIPAERRASLTSRLRPPTEAEIPGCARPSPVRAPPSPIERAARHAAAGDRTHAARLTTPSIDTPFPGAQARAHVLSLPPPPRQQASGWRVYVLVDAATGMTLAMRVTPLPRQEQHRRGDVCEVHDDRRLASRRARPPGPRHPRRVQRERLGSLASALDAGVAPAIPLDLSPTSRQLTAMHPVPRLSITREQPITARIAASSAQD